MRYQGSKYKMRNVLKSIIEPNLGPNTTYVEPFMGGCNSLAYINCKKKVGYDVNKYITALWKGIKDGSFKIPEYVSREEYYDVKNDYLTNGGKYPDAYIGYVSMCCSYGSGFWNGYAQYNPKKNEDHIREAYNGIIKQIKNFVSLENTVFNSGSYTSMKLDGDIFYYCDPPYASTKKYANSFDNESFWQWCREMVAKGNKVLISEYNAPSDFVCIWQKEMQDGMSDNNKTKVEKLFIHSSQVKIFKGI